MDAGLEMQEDLIVELKGVPQRFSYDELSEATRGFSEESTLGYGGFGVVYRAELKSGTQVAIKRMNPRATHSQGLKEFKSEVFIISQLSHRNLIKLPGWCADVARKEYMLVYDLIPNGSLDDVLFKSAEGTAGLSWAQKYKILTGAADGLDYLHHGFNQQVIHRDIKCSNILLDKEWNAKLGDFGIARMVDHQGRAETTNMAGTLGYIAPEVFSEYQFTDKADVFAFGVVILEVACGRRVLPSPSHKIGLVQWVGSAHSKGDLLSIVDKRHTPYDTKQMERVLKVGLLCTQVNRQDRPSMRRIVQMLAGDVKVPAIRALKPTSRLFYRPLWLLSMMKTLTHKDATNGSSSLNNLNLVDIDPEASKVFMYEELNEATNGSSSLNNLNLVDIDPEASKVFMYEELNEATNGSSSLNNLNLVDIDPEASKVFMYEELNEATNGSSSLNNLNLVDIDPEASKVFMYEELNEATNGSSSLNNLNLVDIDPEASKVFMYEELNEATNGSSSLNKLNLVDIDPEASKVFTYEELKEATNGFRLFRRGTFGIVCKGTIAGNLVEVQEVNSCTKCESCQISVLTEFEIMSRVRHRNVVSVLGYCISQYWSDRSDRFLVYEYVPNGTLEGALHGPGAPPMDWATRMNIALGTARGLVYLHDGYHERIIHGNVMASTIHLNNEYDALVGSFGISGFPHYADTFCFPITRTVENYGYVDREFYVTGKLTVKSDVYSFGVVLLELITGMQAWDSNLVVSTKRVVARALKSRNMDALADPHLTDKYDREEMFRMLEVAALCVSFSSADRPKMRRVLKILSTKVRTLQE